MSSSFVQYYFRLIVHRCPNCVGVHVLYREKKVNLF